MSKNQEYAEKYAEYAMEQMRLENPQRVDPVCQTPLTLAAI